MRLRNALDVLTEQQWRTIGIETLALTRRTYAREIARDRLIASGCYRNPGEVPGRGVVWSQVMR